ncbi:MAG TPA: HDOD domain-containing protein [Gammaproteobacteria bacterium]|nr:HDOD domain-containing protein [Gammaproteobacteria bacterium]
MNDALQALIADSPELASLPEVVMRAVDMINDPRTSASDIGAVIRQDPALAMRLLGLVNSSFYGFPSRIETISRAVTVIGTLELLDLILGASVIKAFAGLPSTLVNMHKFWSHSLYTGLVTRGLAVRHRAPNPERYFVAGLLHDVGSLVLYLRRPEQAGQALALARDEGAVLSDAEQALFGFAHAELGAELMGNWKLPPALTEPVRFHHQPSAAVNYPLESALVHLADVIASSVMGCATDSDHVPPLDEAAWQLTGLSVNVIEPVLADADGEFADVRSALLPEASAA